MFATTLQSHMGRIDVSRVAARAGFHRSTFYDWASGRAEPGATNVKCLLVACDDEDLQRGLLSWFVAGTDWQFFRVPESLDLDGNGQVDIDDALSAVIDATEQLARELKDLHQAYRDKRINDQEHTDLNARLDTVVGLLMVGKRIIDALHDAGRRRQAKRPAVVLGDGEEALRG